MLSHVTVKDLVDSHPLTLSADLSVPKAVDLMTEQQLSGAPVCDVNGRLIGFLSMFDVMKELWYKDYQPAKETKVVDLMSSDVVAVDINDRLVDLVEYLCIDKDMLYPSSDMGIATSATSLSLDQRVKALKASKPRVLPVLQDGQFVGVITRDGLMAELRKVYHDVALTEVKKLEIA